MKRFKGMKKTISYVLAIALLLTGGVNLNLTKAKAADTVKKHPVVEWTGSWQKQSSTNDTSTVYTASGANVDLNAGGNWWFKITGMDLSTLQHPTLEVHYVANGDKPQIYGFDGTNWAPTITDNTESSGLFKVELDGSEPNFSGMVFTSYANMLKYTAIYVYDDLGDDDETPPSGGDQPGTDPTTTPPDDGNQNGTTPGTNAQVSAKKTAVTIAAGKSASVGFTASSTPTVTTSDNKIATAAVSGSNVKITVPKSATKGATATITLKVGSKSATIKVTVKNPAKKIKAVKKTVTVKAKKKVTAKFKITATNKKKAVVDTVKVTSKKKKVATVAKYTIKKGKATVSIKGVKKGKTTITLKIGKKSAKVTVKVK